MEAPWVKHPDIPAGSIGWRMGDGQDYYEQFYRWYSALPAAEQDAYVSQTSRRLSGASFTRPSNRILGANGSFPPIPAIRCPT